MKNKLKEKGAKPKDGASTKADKAEEQFPGYPQYSAEEDIYNQEEKIPLEDEDDDQSLSDGLDVPGAELDDAGEVTGNEDEENNYYSLGGDDHSDLDENHED